MEEICKKIVETLKTKKCTISFMESCTGGFLANSITNISGASDILKVSLVTYSTEYKEHFGVDKNIIKQYTVYSMETAKEMSRNVSNLAKSNIGVGVTGELGNTTKDENRVYYSIYFSNINKYITKEIVIESNKREKMKGTVADNIFKDIMEELNGQYE
jgi:PncC family amidohydrolase